MTSPPRHPFPSTSEDSDVADAPLLSNGAHGSIIGGTADDHAILGILAQMSQQQAQGKAHSRAPSAEASNLHASTSTHPPTSSSTVPMPLLPASRPSPSTPAPHLRSTNATTFEHPPPTSTPHPLPALPPLPSLPPHYQQQPSSVEASRETSVDADAEGEEEAANASAGGSTRGGRGRGKATGGGGGGTRGKGNASAVPASAATPAGTGETGAGEQAEVDWSRTRKDNHKEVERRRRETINEGISSLALLLPSPSTNKGSILKQAVSYIAELKQGEQRQIEKWALEKLLHEQAMAKVVEEREGWKIYAEGLERERERWRAGAGVEGQEGEQEGESKVGTNGKRVAVDEVANSNGAAVVDGLGEGPAPKKARVEEGAS